MRRARADRRAVCVPLPIGMMNNKKIRDLAWAGMLCALALALTLVSVPLPPGYINLGDVAVLFAAFTLPMWYAALAAGVGAALADLILGFAVYAPATLVIKSLAALTACLLLKPMGRHKALRLVALVIASLIIPAGYLVYEGWVLGYGAATALAGLPWNLLQAGVGAVAAYALSFLADRYLKHE